jgi:hypothetical protein
VGITMEIILTLFTLGALVYYTIIKPFHEQLKKISNPVTDQNHTVEPDAGKPFPTAGSASFSASETAGNGLDEISEKEKRDERFYDRMLLIAAGIGAGMGKTKILKSLPGYSGDIHARLSNMYEGIKQTLETSSHWAKMRKQ